MSSNINKVVFNGNTLIDLTSDTVNAASLAYGVTAHDKSGTLITGSNTYDSNTTDADAVAGEILYGKTAYVNKNKLTGQMVNNGATTGSISSVSDEYTIAAGYHDGSGKVSIDSTEQAKIISQNIRSGITILGVEGSMTGTEAVTAESITVTSGATSQTVTPSTGYNYISQVIVNAIPYSTSSNAAGGLTATIGS